MSVHLRVLFLVYWHNLVYDLDEIRYNKDYSDDWAVVVVVKWSAP